MEGSIWRFTADSDGAAIFGSRLWRGNR
jgi:hypothetical protein